MESVASELKSEREKRKISLAQIAADTKISLHYLESLEAGRYDDLPGGIYNRAFLRAFCESLDLDQKEMIQRYEAEISPIPEKTPKPKGHVSPQVSSLKISPVIVWSLMLLISATGLFFSRKWIAEVFSPYFSHAPAATVQLKQPTATIVSPPGEASTGGASSSAELSVLSDTGKAKPSPIPQSQIPAPTLESVAQAATIPEVGESTSTPLNASTISLRLQIVGTEECWISIDRDGSPVIRKLLEPGETQSFNAAEKFFIVLGNAGGVHLRINGKPTKTLGKSGEVVKLLITEKNLSDLIDQTAG
jgi:cytoskeleton protein RodZ